MSALRAAVFAAVGAALGLLALDAAMAPVAREDFDAYAPIFRFDPLRWAALRENADAVLPVGVFLPEVWKGRGETYRVRVDARGERAPAEAAPAPEGARTLLCLGDSATFGWDVEWEETYCARLAALLSEGGPPYAARNLGVPGYSSLQGRIALELAQDLRPAWTVLAFGANDAAPVAARDYRFLRGRTDAEILLRGAQGPLPVPAWMSVAAWAEDTRLFRGLARVLDRTAKPGAPGGPGRARASPREYEENLRAAAALARARGSAVAVLTVAVKDDAYRQAAEALAEAEDLPYVDADALFAAIAERRLVPEGYEDMAEKLQGILGSDLLVRDPQLRATTDHGHPNAVGHRAIAEALAARMGGRRTAEK